MDYRADYRCKRRDDIEDAAEKKRAELSVGDVGYIASFLPDLPGSEMILAPFLDARLRRLLLAHIEGHGAPLTSLPDAEKAKVAGNRGANCRFQRSCAAVASG